MALETSPPGPWKSPQATPPGPRPRALIGPAGSAALLTSLATATVAPGMWPWEGQLEGNVALELNK